MEEAGSLDDLASLLKEEYKHTHRREPSVDEFLRHKAGYCWKLGEAGDRTFPNSFKGTVALPAHSPETPDSRLIRNPVPGDLSHGRILLQSPWQAC